MKRAPALLLVLALVASAPAARADAESLDPPAEARFKEGIAYAKQGKYEQARASFLQTLVLSPASSKVLLNLAIAEHGAGRLVESLGHLKAYLASPKLEPKKADEIRASLYEELWRATGHLRIEAKPGEPVVLDASTKLGNAPLADVVDVVAGSHRISVGTRSVEVAVAAGETKDVDLLSPEPAGPIAAATVSLPATGPPPVVPAEPSNLTRNVVSGSLVAVGVIGTGIAVGFTLAANGASDDLARAKAAAGPRADQACAGVQTPECEARASASGDLVRNTNLARAMYIGGGAALIGGLVALFLWPKATNLRATSSARVITPWLGAGGFGLSYGGEL